MKLNEHIALLTPKVLLVPYSTHHVPTYHTWMQDPVLQAATASEPLTLEEEYTMQASWRTDVDKLTFIVCASPSSNPEHITTGKEDGPRDMIGDVNLFLNPDDEEEMGDGRGKGSIAVIGELEIMIAEKLQQGKGLGREVLLAFLWYVFHSYKAIMSEYHNTDGNGQTSNYIKHLRVKIDKDNVRSIRLFEGVGFSKVSETPNYFGELELRWEMSGEAAKDVETRMGAMPRMLAYTS